MYGHCLTDRSFWILIIQLIYDEFLLWKMQAALWILFGVFALIKFEADYCLVVGVCLTLSIANIVGFTKCHKGNLKACSEQGLNRLLSVSHQRLPIIFCVLMSGYIFLSDAKIQFQQFATQTIASRFTSTVQSAFSIV